MSKNLLSMVFENYRGPHDRRLVLMALAKHANDDGSSCFPAVLKLAELACVRRSTVQRALHDLEREGMIRILHRGGAGRGDVSRYRLNVEAIKKGRNGNTFIEEEKGRNEAQEGPRRDMKKGRNGDPDSVIDSINDSAFVRAAHNEAASNKDAGARAREGPRPINKSMQSANPARSEMAETCLKQMRDLLAVKKPQSA